MRIITLFLLIITNALRLIDAKKKQNTQYQISKNVLRVVRMSLIINIYILVNVIRVMKLLKQKMMILLQQRFVKRKIQFQGGPTYVVSHSYINSDEFINSEGIKTQAKIFAQSFGNINTHVIIITIVRIFQQFIIIIHILLNII